MADETTDISNSEQVTIFIHWVTDTQGIYWILHYRFHLTSNFSLRPKEQICVTQH